MQSVIKFGTWIINNYDMIIALIVSIIAAVSALSGALAGLFLIIPGEQPEKFFFALQAKCNAFGEYLKKYSKKPTTAVIEEKPAPQSDDGKK